MRTSSLADFVRLCCLSLLVLSGVCAANAAAPLPVDAFASLPAVAQASLSPDGQRIALLVNTEGVTTILTQNLDGQPRRSQRVLETDNVKFQFNWFRWVNNERLLVSLRFPSKRRSYDTMETRLLSVRFDGGKPINLVLPQSFRGEWQAAAQDRVIDWLPEDGKHVLLEVSSGDVDWDTAVYKVNVDDASRSVVQVSRQDFYSWMTDRQHRVRIGWYRKNGQYEIHACDPDGQNWRKLWAFSALDKREVTPIGFDKDPNLLYIIADHNGRNAVSVVDLRDPGLKRSIKLADESRDIGSSLVYSPAGDAVGIRGAALGNTGARFWDAGFRDFVASIDEALPNRFNSLGSMSADGARYLVLSSSPRSGLEFYLGDNLKDELKFYAAAYPGLPAARMSPKQPVRVKARDGLELPGYLTLPLDQAPKNLPAIVLVHGGPQSHDNADFDVWTQFLANRGYAVLQVNYRGSTGHGRALMSAGLGRWGMEMQDDLADATRWLAARGTADPKRICIVGASFGGYAALMGAAKFPELYRCAASFAGVTDLVELAGDNSYPGLKEVFALQVGSDRERLRATSPRNLAQQIGIPLLLIHGTADRSVPYLQAQWMAEALNAAGKPFRFVTQQDGDHYLSIYAHNMQFFRELEQFLGQNLGTAAP